MDIFRALPEIAFSQRHVDFSCRMNIAIHDLGEDVMASSVADPANKIH